MVLPERQDHAYSPLRLGSLAASSRCELRFMNQTFCPFDEKPNRRRGSSQAAQRPRGDRPDLRPRPVWRTRPCADGSAGWRSPIRKAVLPPEIESPQVPFETLHKDFLEPSGERCWLLSNQSRGLIQLLEVLPAYEGSACKGLLDFWILR